VREREREKFYIVLNIVKKKKFVKRSKYAISKSFIYLQTNFKINLTMKKIKTERLKISSMVPSKCMYENQSRIMLHIFNDLFLPHSRPTRY